MQAAGRFVVLAACVALTAGAQARAQTGTALPMKHAPARTQTAITPADLMTRVYLYADDSMMGRMAGSEYNLKATAYIAAEVRRLGLVPAGDSGGYFQNVPFMARTLDSATTILANGATLAAYKDFVVVPFRGVLPRAIDGAQVVFGGVLGDTAHALTAAQAEGKFVV